MAAGDLNAAAAQRVGGKVQHRRGGHSDINHLQAGCNQAAYQRRTQRRPAEPAVAANRHRQFTQRACRAAKGPTQRLGQVLIDGARHNAANIVSLENGSC